MKIGNPLDLIRTGQAGSGTHAPDKAKTEASTAAAHGSSSPSVKISSGLADLTAEMKTDPDTFDAKRVEAMKAAIADGSFKVDAAVVADKVIASNLEALSRSKP